MSRNEGNGAFVRAGAIEAVSVSTQSVSLQRVNVPALLEVVLLRGRFARKAHLEWFFGIRHSEAGANTTSGLSLVGGGYKYMVQR